MPRLSAAHSVHALARSPGSSSDNIQWHRIDLAGPSALWALPPQWDVTVYLAQSDGYRDFPARATDMSAVNVHGAVAMLDASLRHGATRFLLASTANVYDVAHHAIDEHATVNPTSFYARTRRAAELLAEPFAEQLDVTVARMFTIYGPGQRPDTLIPSVIDRVRAGRAVRVQGERGLLLSPVYLADAVDAIIRLVERPADTRGFTIVNVAGNEFVGVGELASMVGDIVGRQPVVERVPGPEPGGWIGDTSLLRTLTGWNARTTLRQGLEVSVAARA
jgi:UDP-glucuronate 4-epimerase